MSEWKKVKLGDCCVNVTSGGTPLSSRNDYYNPSTIPWLKTKEVNYNRIYDTEFKISQNGLENSSAKLIPEDSVIIAMYGQGDTAGRVAINKIPLCTNQACCNLIIDKSIANYEFIYYLLCTKYDKLVSLKNGGAQPNLNAKLIKEFNIEIPVITIQDRIAEILSRYDSLIENYQKQIKLLEESAQRLYKEWFVDLRFPGHENTKIVDGVPEGWKKKRINEFASILSGYAFKSSTFEENGYYNIVTIKNVQNGFFEGKRLNHIRKLPPGMPQHCLLNTGDLLLSLTGNIGRVCMVIGKNNLLNQRVAKIESKYPAFVYCLFRSNSMFTAINNLGNGAAQQNVSPIRIGELEIIFANDEIISNFEKITSNIRKQILLLHSKINLLSEARDRLLPKLMSGEIEV